MKNYTHIGFCIIEFETAYEHDMDSCYSFQHVSRFLDGLQHNIVIADFPLQCAIWNKSNLQEQL